jgi:hypothetical protein
VIAIVPKYQTFPFSYYYRTPSPLLSIDQNNLQDFEDILLSSRHTWWIFAGDEIIDREKIVKTWVENHFEIVKRHEIKNIRYEITGDSILLLKTKPENTNRQGEH